MRNARTAKSGNVENFFPKPQHVQMGPPNTTKIILGLDLGEVKDYTALTALEATRPEGQRRRHYDCRLLHRWPLRTSYEDITEHLRVIAGNLPMPPVLVIDATGAGRPVAQTIRQAKLPIAPFIGVMITGGNKVIQEEDGYYHVPKRELVSHVQTTLQSGCLKIATKLSHAQILTRELQTFRSKININTGNESFEAWRTKDHDDMVLATALALWWGESFGKRLGADSFFM